MKELLLIAAVVLFALFCVWARHVGCEDSGGRMVYTGNGDSFCLPPQGEP